MRELDLAKIFLITMPPSSNSVQEEIKFYLQDNAEKVNDEIFSLPRFRDRATIISSMFIELRFDVCRKIFDERPSRNLKISFKNLFLAQDIEKYKIDLELFKERYMNNKVVLLLLERKKN